MLGGLFTGLISYIIVISFPEWADPRAMCIGTILGAIGLGINIAIDRE